MTIHDLIFAPDIIVCPWCKGVFYADPDIEVVTCNVCNHNSTQDDYRNMDDD